MPAQNTSSKLTALFISLVTTPLVPAATVIFDDFDNGNYQEVNSYSGGSTSNFWSANGQYSEDTGNSNLVATIDSTNGNFRSANTFSSFSSDFNFFNQTITVGARGLGYDGTTGTGADLTITQMQTVFGLLGDGFVAPSAQDAIWAEVRADGRVRLRSRVDGVNQGTGGALATLTTTNVTGFDLTLGPGTLGTDYILTIYGDTTETTSGNLSNLTQAGWGAGDDLTRLGIFAQETDGIQPGAGESIMVSTVGSYTFDAEPIPEPSSAILLGLCASGLFFRRRR